MNNCSFCEEIAKWYNQPMRANGSALNWIMFVGLVMVAVFLWTRVLARIV